MAYSYPFQLLSPIDVRYLTVSDNNEARSTYVYCLALLQQVLAPLGTGFNFTVPEDPVVAVKAIEEAINKMPALVFVQSPTNEPLSTTPEAQIEIIRRRLIEKLKVNTETAVDLYNEYQSLSRIGIGEARKLVDDYLYSLITQYTILRRAENQYVPAAAAASAQF